MDKRHGIEVRAVTEKVHVLAAKHDRICYEVTGGTRNQVLTIGHLIVCLLFYVLARSKVISGRAPTCDSAHSW